MSNTKWKYITIVFVSVAVSESTGQNRTAEQTIMEVKNLVQQGSNSASKEKYEQGQRILDQFEFQDNYQAIVEYYHGYINYQLAVVINRMDKEKARMNLDSAIVHLEKALEINDNDAESHALLASCYGMQIAFSPFSGLWRGPKSSSEMSKAIKLAKDNPRVALLGAIGIYNTPSLFGGGKEKGFEALKEAEKLFGRWKTIDSLQPDWGKEQVYAWIGLAHLDRNETILARKAFEKALEINPNYGWVKNVLMKKVTTDNDAK